MNTNGSFLVILQYTFSGWNGAGSGASTVAAATVLVGSIMLATAATVLAGSTTPALVGLTTAVVEASSSHLHALRWPTGMKVKSL